MPLTLQISSTTTIPTLKSNYRTRTNNKNKNKSNNHHFSRTFPTKSPSKVSPSSPLLHLERKSNRHYPPPPEYAAFNPNKNFAKQTVLNQGLKTLLVKLKRKGSDPLQILKDDGDWTEDHFWAALRFLEQSSRSKEVPQVFEVWKMIEKSRINQRNYEKIIGLLVEEGLTEEALSAFQEMMVHGLKPSLEIYNLIIHGFAWNGKFEDALYYLKEMEDIGLKPDTETYDGLIRAYGKYEMYDEMHGCVRKMEANGCSPDHITYNLLIQEFSQAGLLTRMERLCQTLISKRMDLQSPTLVAMLEAYANFGILDKMEKVYRRVLHSNTILKENCIRKLARVYILNHMFSRLDDLGHDLSAKTGKTDLVWCLHILSHACVLSRNGLDSVLREMELEKFPWSVTVANILLLTYVKMKDFKHLRVVLFELAARRVKPDIVTLGVVFDAYDIGFDGIRALNTWRRMGFLGKAVEMNTDALVLTAFGKGHFLSSCEDLYSSLQTEARERRIWTYQHLIDLVFEHNKRLPQLMGVDQSQGTHQGCHR